MCLGHFPDGTTRLTFSKGSLDFNKLSEVVKLPPVFSIYECSSDFRAPLPELCIEFVLWEAHVVCDTLHAYSNSKVQPSIFVQIFLCVIYSSHSFVKWCSSKKWLQKCFYLKSSTFATLFVRMFFSRRSFLISSFRSRMSSSLCRYWISPTNQHQLINKTNLFQLKIGRFSWTLQVGRMHRI